MFLKDFLPFGRVPSGFELLRSEPVLAVEVTVAFGKERPKGEGRVSVGSLKRVLREGLMQRGS